ncbi:YibE/F family protein [Candidatus Microgenomates bacterium]|nr:YibE/F family protein [Candidatus Microgenomates bacterium]
MQKSKLHLISLFFSLIFLFLLAILQPVLAQETALKYDKEERIEAVVVKISQEKEITVMGKENLSQTLELEFLPPALRKRVTLTTGNIPTAYQPVYKVNDTVVLNSLVTGNGEKTYIITDYVRRDALYWLFLIFVILTIFVARRRGIFSLLGMFISFFLIVKFLLPQIMSGNDPILIAVLTALAIIPLTFYLSHGINLKTSIAVLGTVTALIISGLLANYFIVSAKLSGFSSEEAVFLQVQNPNFANIRGLILAGIIIGLVGILDDITISQAAIVRQLKTNSPKLGFWELYQGAMEVGKDHIASLVNTLILVYTGAALPLLLLFVNNPAPFADVINLELVAEEILRALVASIGLILAVPITSLLAAVVFGNKKYYDLRINIK